MTPLSVAIERDTRLGRPAAGAPLTLRGVRRSFGAKTVLDGVDLHARDEDRRDGDHLHARVCGGAG